MNEFFKRALILIGALLVMLPCKAAEWVGDLLFVHSSYGVILFECSSNAEGRIVIPSSVELKDQWGDRHIFEVIKIGDRAFKDCTGITSVEIPETITEIGSAAFSGCTGLTSINLPESITEIGYAAFSGCTGLTSINLPESITKINGDTFRGCTGLSSITIPGSVTRLESNPSAVFSGCTSLKEVIFEPSDEILYISNTYRFEYIADHRTFHAAFEDCPNLNKIEVNRILGCFTHDLNWDYNEYVVWERGIFAEVPVSEIVFGPECSVITEMEFAGMEKLEKISIPTTVQTIMPDAFADCSNLKNVTFEESADPLYMIGDFGKSGIEVLNLQRQLFEGTVEIETLGTFTCKPNFSDCTGLTSIIFGGNVSTLGDNMFSGCTALRSVTIPQFISKIGEGAFSGCLNLKSINIEDCDEPILINSKTNADGEGTTFAGAPIETLYLGRNVEFSGTELSPFKNKTLLTTLTIGNKTTAINNYLFYGCTNISMLSVPSSVKTIGDYAFYDCNQSRSLSISRSVESIGEYAFYNCKNLKTLTIPASVVTIGDYAFRSCSNLTKITIGSKVEKIGNYAFLDCYSAEEITLGESVKTIGNNAFYNCQGWKNINIPNSVKTIGDDAFALCLGATEATIGNGVETIGLRSFTDCEGLTKLTIGAGVKEIGDMAFFNCENLKEIYVGAPVPPTANESVFSDYSAKLYVPEGKSSLYKGDSDNCWPLFSSMGEYDALSGVEEVEISPADSSIVEVYDLKGTKLGKSLEGLPGGIYIVRQGTETKKMVIR